MAKVNILVVVANDRKAYSTNYGASMVENTDVRYANENRFDDFRGWHLDAVIYIGNVSALHRQEFDTLVRKAPRDTGKVARINAKDGGFKL